MRSIGLVAAVALCPAAALAQPVFFDDFDGPDLLPHWERTDPSRWEYDLSGGMLNVTGLFWPGIPHLGGNDAVIAASFDWQSDFRVDAWMGWDEGDMPHGLSLQVVGPGGLVGIASFSYRDEQPGRDPLLIAGSGTEGVVVPAPRPGMYSSRRVISRRTVRVG